MCIALFSCKEKSEDESVLTKKKYSILMSNDGNWTGSQIECDSFNMVNKNKVIIWSDKTKSTIMASELRIVSN